MAKPSRRSGVCAIGTSTEYPKGNPGCPHTRLKFVLLLANLESGRRHFSQTSHDELPSDALTLRRSDALTFRISDEGIQPKNAKYPALIHSRFWYLIDQLNALAHQWCIPVP